MEAMSSKLTSFGTINVYGMEKGKVVVGMSDSEPTKKILHEDRSGDKFFSFNHTDWYIGYDFNLAYDAGSDEFFRSETFPFFVYGSLRNGFWNYRGVLEGRTAKEMEGTIQGIIYHNGSFPFLFEGDKEVKGEIMFLNEEDYYPILKRMDALEGYRGESYKYNRYNRKLIDVTMANGDTVKAWAYFANDSRGNMVKEERLTLIMDGDYKRWAIEYEQ